MFCQYLLTMNKNVQIRYDNTFFYFYPLVDAEFVKHRKQLALVHAI